MDEEIRTELKRCLEMDFFNIEDENDFGKMLPKMIESKDIELVHFKREIVDPDGIFQHRYTAIFEYTQPYSRDVCFVKLTIEPSDCDRWDLADKFARMVMMQDVIDRGTLVADPQEV